MVAFGGCSPTLDWREFEPEGSGVTVAFPCRPDHHSRSVRVADTAVRMDMFVCPAGDFTFALAYLDAANPADVSASLKALRTSASANVGGNVQAGVLRVPGMTPNGYAARIRLVGIRPDGLPIQQQAVFFAKGLRVYQASVIGRTVSDEAGDTFFASLKLPS